MGSLRSCRSQRLTVLTMIIITVGGVATLTAIALVAAAYVGQAVAVVSFVLLLDISAVPRGAVHQSKAILDLDRQWHLAVILLQHQLPQAPMAGVHALAILDDTGDLLKTLANLEGHKR